MQGLREDALWERPVDRLIIQTQRKVLKDLKELRNDINSMKASIAEMQIRIRTHLEER